MANVERTISVLSRTPLFQGLKKRQLERFARRFVERDYKEGDVIVEQGSGGEGFYIIDKGAAKAVRELPGGEEVVVNTFGPADFFGELALLAEGPRTASVIATQPTSCLILTRWDFLGTLRDDADTAVAILQEVAKRFRMALDAL
jgi:CRP-like cAMP-binding protein